MRLSHSSNSPSFIHQTHLLFMPSLNFFWVKRSEKKEEEEQWPAIASPSIHIILILMMITVISTLLPKTVYPVQIILTLKSLAIRNLFLFVNNFLGSEEQQHIIPDLYSTAAYIPNNNYSKEYEIDEFYVLFNQIFLHIYYTFVELWGIKIRCMHD